MFLSTWNFTQTALSQSASQEGKQVYVLYELGNKTPLDAWVHYEPLNMFSRRLGGKSSEKFTTLNLKLAWYSFSK